MNHQKTFIKDYLEYPRVHGENNFSKAAYMPDYEPKSNLALSVFGKAKQHIKKLERNYKVTEYVKKKKQNTTTSLARLQEQTS